MKTNTVAEPVNMTPSEVDQLLNYFEMLEEREAALKEEAALVKAKITAVLRGKYGELHPGEYELRGNRYTLDVEVGQVWSWDSELLMQLAEVHPTPHVQVSAKIDRAKFQTLPDALKLKFHDALTIKSGRAKFTLRGGE